MDTRAKVEQDVMAAADCWARGVLHNDRVLDLTEQNLLYAILAYDKYMKRNGLGSSHIPPPPNVPHDMDIEDQVPTVRYSDHITVKAPPMPYSEPAPESDDIF